MSTFCVDFVHVFRQKGNNDLTINDYPHIVIMQLAIVYCMQA